MVGAPTSFQGAHLRSLYAVSERLSLVSHSKRACTKVSDGKGANRRTRYLIEDRAEDGALQVAFKGSHILHSRQQEVLD